MFYRYTPAGARIAVDLEGFYQGQTLFLLGGNPKLLNALHLLTLPGVITLAMNNVPAIFHRPTLWIGADKPACFSSRFLARPETLKFTMLSRRDEVIDDGRRVRELPSLLFFGASEGATYETFLASRRDLTWWKSTFMLALQLAYRLGFRRVYLVGCAFDMDHKPGKQYAWQTALTQDQVRYSQQTYKRDLERLAQLKPHFDQAGFSVVSATQGSAANRVLGYEDLARVVARARDELPGPRQITELPHSSEHA